ncbi:hypothetical protein V6N13_116170 [Hibiscus sabdariffa]|uniref:Uncharacterized protein n=1 Tax=Hibiscus sabdariffa TaxID=183260 RepID=A0ABR2BNC1_9ROSI
MKEVNPETSFLLHGGEGSRLEKTDSLDSKHDNLSIKSRVRALGSVNRNSEIMSKSDPRGRKLGRNSSHDQ